MIEINNKKYRNLQEQVKKNQDDIADIVERGGKGYSAGASIVITEGDETDTIDVKSGVFIKDNDTSYSSLFRGKGVWVKEEGAYTSTSYGDGAIGRSIPNQPGYTYNLPNASGTLALADNIPTNTSDLTNDSGFLTASTLPTLSHYRTVVTGTSNFTFWYYFKDFNFDTTMSADAQVRNVGMYTLVWCPSLEKLGLCIQAALGADVYDLSGNLLGSVDFTGTFSASTTKLS